MHNSNHQKQQTNLLGEIKKAEKFYVIGFISIDIINLREDVWSKKLDSERISAVEEYLSRPRQMYGEN